VSASNVLAELRAWSQFVGLQIEYSLLQRAPERDLVPMAQHSGLGVLSWGPLGAGVLTGKDTLGASAVKLDEVHLARLAEVSRIDLGFPHDFLRSDGGSRHHPLESARAHRRSTRAAPRRATIRRDGFRAVTWSQAGISHRDAHNAPRHGWMTESAP